MASIHSTGALANISVQRIRQNPDNPRITFRQGELEELQESIRQYGIQVPIAVFRLCAHRWRASMAMRVKAKPEDNPRSDPKSTGAARESATDVQHPRSARAVGLDDDRSEVTKDQ